MGSGRFVPGIQVNDEHKDVAAPEREVVVYKEEVRQALSFIVAQSEARSWSSSRRS